MTGKEFLNQAYRLDQQIGSKLQQVESLRSLTQRVTATYGGVAVSRTRNPSSLEDTIARLIETEEALNREIDRLVDLKLEISGIINQVHNENYRLILEKRYLCFLSWDQIASDLKISRRWVEIQHDRAVNVVDKLLQKQGVCQ